MLIFVDVDGITPRTGYWLLELLVFDLYIGSFKIRLQAQLGISSFIVRAGGEDDPLNRQVDAMVPLNVGMASWSHLSFLMQSTF